MKIDLTSIILIILTYICTIYIGKIANISHKNVNKQIIEFL